MMKPIIVPTDHQLGYLNDPAISPPVATPYPWLDLPWMAGAHTRPTTT